MASFLPVLASAQEITRVTVIHQKIYNVATTLYEAGELAAFERLWNAKTPSVLTVEPHWIYKIEIITAPNSDPTPWLYDPSGWTKLRSNTETPIYKLSTPDAFNTTLRIDQAE